jgi:predicted nucleic acid-binding protein
MVIVDSSVMIDFLGGYLTPQTKWLLGQASFRDLALTSLILTEVLQGIRDDDRLDATWAVLSRFAIFETASRELAIRSALNYRTLRALGFTIRSTIDCLIATFCIEEGHKLLYRDSDFDHFAQHLGLRVVDLSADTPN